MFYVTCSTRQVNFKTIRADDNRGLIACTRQHNVSYSRLPGVVPARSVSCGMFRPLAKVCVLIMITLFQQSLGHMNQVGPRLRLNKALTYLTSDNIKYVIFTGNKCHLALHTFSSPEQPTQTKNII